MPPVGKRLNDFEHCFKRPDMYLGSIASERQKVWIYSDDDKCFRHEEVDYNQGLDRIFIEVISNAIDNRWRSEQQNIKMSKITIDADKETGEISVYNDGAYIPVEMQKFDYTDHKTGKKIVEECYPAENYFGSFRSSTNYDDDEERKTSGRNGVGCKITVCFSKVFTVEHTDPSNKKKFTQVFKNHGSKRTEPCIERYQAKTGYTKISFIPDYEAFGYADGMTDDFFNLIYRHAFDTAMITGLNVYFNGEKLKVNDLEKYARMYYPGCRAMSFAIKSKKSVSEAVIIDKSTVEVPEDNTLPQVGQISFVNGVPTHLGGVHVKKWQEAIFTSLVKYMNSKAKKNDPQVSSKDMFPYFVMFVKCEVDKPKFHSQSKDLLVEPAPTIVKPTEEQMAKIAKWPFKKLLIEKLLTGKERKLTKNVKTEKRVSLGTKGQDANKAGTKKGVECTLHITEGLSAMTLALQGISELPGDNDLNGVLAIKGKFINAVKQSLSKVSSNEEVQMLIKMMGLKHGVDYTDDDNYKKLRYGTINTFCDADKDGDHIRGLLIAFFWKQYPSLIARKKFLYSLSSPILVVKHSKIEQPFYTQSEYEEWAKKNKVKTKPKYFKGLGTSNARQGKEIFRNFRRLIFYCEGDEKEYMDLGFSEDATNSRKLWLTRHVPKENLDIKLEDVTDESKNIEIKRIKPEVDDQSDGKMSISYFVDTRLRSYGLTSLERAIPCVLDGLKNGQRKILYWCLTKNISEKNEMKVDELTGDVTKNTGYHHGAASVYETIIKMAQGFVGSNNIPLLANSGMFGTRFQGGEDAAAPRYLYTYAEKVARALFHINDDNILERVSEEGKEYEPYFYVPILPMLLVNGSQGVATGFSTKILPHNPLDLVENIRRKIAGKEIKPLVPWARGFEGKNEIATKGNAKVWVTTGVMSKEDDGWYKISELPIRVWTLAYKEKYIEELVSEKKKTEKKKGEKKEEKKIKEYNIYTKDRDIDIWFKPVDGFKPTKENMGLVHKETISNMYALNEHGCPVKFESTSDIFEYYFPRRLALYTIRKRYLLNQMKHELVLNKNRYKFIKEVAIDKTLDLYQTHDQITKELEERGYDKLSVSGEDEGKSFAYLLNMSARSFNRDKADEIKESVQRIKKDVEILTKKSPGDLWIEDLDNFEKEYELFLEERHQRDNNQGKKKAPARRKKAVKEDDE